MRRSWRTSCAVFGLLALLCALPGCSVNVKKDGAEDSRNLDIKTPMVGLHVGKDADARETGLPLYPGARKTVKKSGGDDQSANLSIATSAFGLKVIAVEFESDDPPQKVVDFYKDKLKQYGNVLECHSHDQGGNVNINSGGDDSRKKQSKELKCEDNDGPVIELKAGSQENQHLVSVKTQGQGTKFALVHVQTRGGDTI